MKIRFFEKDGQINLDAILYAGIYQFKIGVLGDSEDRYLPLYIGQSASMVRRGSEHLRELIQNPFYWGLTKENLENEKLELVADIYKVVPDKKSLRKEERSAIKKTRPLSQNENNDKLNDDRFKVVQTAIEELLSDR